MSYSSAVCSELDGSYLGLFGEPRSSIGITLAVPLDNDDGLYSIVSTTLYRAPYIAIAVLRYGENSISKLEIIPNDTLRSHKKISCLDVLSWLKSLGVDIIVVPRTDRTLSILEKSGIRFILVDPCLKLREALELFLNG